MAVQASCSRDLSAAARLTGPVIDQVDEVVTPFDQAVSARPSRAKIKAAEALLERAKAGEARSILIVCVVTVRVTHLITSYTGLGVGPGRPGRGRIETPAHRRFGGSSRSSERIMAGVDRVR
ncbi:hypothetical protein [Nonomuraea jabiensis]|uniref:Uncharacterized protein n=1 Tax=Nonomuraea jabiensis TaxID=882448 RepID=A0A7W9GGP9_9ACTN|nr:hypothetical protein [Nonomuraea jabiensis]MBB5783457.1 hypothetical protein [Nonomuraea jabiensis]